MDICVLASRLVMLCVLCEGVKLSIALGALLPFRKGGGGAGKETCSFWNLHFVVCLVYIPHLMIGLSSQWCWYNDYICYFHLFQLSDPTRDYVLLHATHCPMRRCASAFL